MEQETMIERLTEREVRERTGSFLAAGRTDADAVWRVCRHCGDDIEPSDPNYAYCDMKCKRSSMVSETEGE